MPSLSLIDRPKHVGSVGRMPDAIPPSSATSESAEASFVIRAKKKFLDPADWLKSAEGVVEKSRDAAIRLQTSTAWARVVQASTVAGNVGSAVEASKELLCALSEQQPRDNERVLYALAATTLVRAGQVEVLRDAAANLPDRIDTSGVEITICASEGDLVGAYSLLLESDSLRDLSTRGYLELELGKTHEAIRTLRLAVSEDLASPDDRINLALALWRTGSRKKAARVALEAMRMAPGRRDISLDAMRFMLATGHTDVVKREIDGLRARRVTEDADFLRLEVDYLDVTGQPERGVRKIAELLKKFELSARDRSELDALSMLFEARVGKVSRKESFGFTLHALKDQPENHVLVDWLIEAMDRQEQVDIARSYFERVRDEYSSAYQLQLEGQLAFAEEDFDSALDIAKRLRLVDPRSEYGISSEFMLAGHIRNDWSAGASWFLRALDRNLPLSKFLTNQGAFILASTRHGEEALRLLARVPDSDYQMRATAGLARMAAGDFDGGMREYRRAFEQVPSGPAGDSDRALMAVYQGQALFRLGLIDHLPEQVVRANALPLTEIPDASELSSSFAVLRRCAEINNWPWPTLVV